jgi:hypothetical protein
MGTNEALHQTSTQAIGSDYIIGDAPRRFLTRQLRGNIKVKTIDTV